MRKDYASELTKDELIKAGVCAVDFENCKVYGCKKELIPTINKQGYLMISIYDLDDNGEKIKVPIKRQFKGCKKPTYTYTYKTILVSLNRLLWAWKYGKVKAGYVIDHVNNKHKNLEDYKLENLQEITPAQNLAKERKKSDLMVKPARNKTINYYLIKLDYYLNLYEQAKKDHDAENAHRLRSNISQTRARIRWIQTYGQSEAEALIAKKQAYLETKIDSDVYHAKAEVIKLLKENISKRRAEYKNALETNGSKHETTLSLKAEWKRARKELNDFEWAAFGSDKSHLPELINTYTKRALSNL